MPKTTHPSSHAATPATLNLQDLLDDFLDAVHNTRLRLERVIEHQAWTVAGRASFTEWWLAEIAAHQHLTKEVAYTAAAQMILEGNEHTALEQLYGVQDHTIINIKVAIAAGVGPWTLAYNYPQPGTGAQRKLVLEFTDADFVTDFKRTCSRARVEHKAVAMRVLAATMDALNAGVSADDIVDAIAALSLNGAVTGGPGAAGQAGGGAGGSGPATDTDEHTA